MDVERLLWESLRRQRDEIDRLTQRGDEAHALVADQMRTISSQLDEIERLLARNDDLHAALSIERSNRALYDEKIERLRALLREAQAWINLVEDDGVILDARIDAALGGTADQPPAYHTDPTGTEREPPHCPTCGCGAPVDQPDVSR